MIRATSRRRASSTSRAACWNSGSRPRCRTSPPPSSCIAASASAVRSPPPRCSTSATRTSATTATAFSTGSAPVCRSSSPADLARPGTFTRLSQPTEVEVAGLEVLVDARAPAFAPQPRLLDAAERRLGRGDEAAVDADHAVLELLAEPPGAAKVARVGVGGQPEFAGVGLADDVGFVVKADQRRDRAEGFVAADLHVGLCLGQHRRLEELPAERMARPAGEKRRAARKRFGDVRFEPGERGGVDERADLYAGLEALADLQLADRRAEFFSEGVVHRLVHEHAVGAHAGLA